MNKILKCKNNQNIFEKLSIQRLKKYPIYNEIFINLVTQNIKDSYDDIDESFAKRLIEIDKKGFDEYGFFTLGKDIWICFYDDLPIGFEVITRKRGGSIKLGPTCLLPEYRGKGFAKEMIEMVCNNYVKNGARKVYVTAPINNYSTAVLDYSKLNLKLEAVLCKNYSKNSSDRVCGKFFNKKNNNKECIPVRTNQGPNLIKKIIKNNLLEINCEKLNDFICENMKMYFDDIDRTFTKAIVTGSCGENKLVYEHKCKDSFIVLENDEIECLVVATPKRGGNYKVSPFLISNSYLNEKNILELVNEIEQSACLLKRRKISIFVPVGEVVIANTLSMNNYFCEGILREPYKENCDIILFSKFIEEQK